MGLSVLNFSEVSTCWCRKGYPRKKERQLQKSQRRTLVILNQGFLASVKSIIQMIECFKKILVDEK